MKYEHIKLKSYIVDLQMRREILASVLPSCWSLATAISPALTNGVEGLMRKLQCCCADNEQCQYCGGELIQRLGILLLSTFFCMQKPGGQKHMCAVSVL